MKKIFFVTALFIVIIAQAQIFEPVKWTTAVKKISSTEYDKMVVIKSGSLDQDGNP